MLESQRHAKGQAHRDDVVVAVHALRSRMETTPGGAAEGLPERRLQVALLEQAPPAAAREAGEGVSGLEASEAEYK